MQADDIIKATLAGFFAGEGCISFSHSSKKTKVPVLRLYVGNTEIVWPRMFQARYGGYLTTQIVKTKNYPYYKWQIGDFKAETALLELLPFLIGEKVEQAHIALELINAKRTFSKGNKYYHFTEQERLSMEGIFDKLKECRRAAAETKRSKVSPTLCDSPTPQVIEERVERPHPKQ